MEWSLVLFTIFTQIAAGLALVLWLARLVPGWRNPGMREKTSWKWVSLLAAVGVAALLLYSQRSPEEARVLTRPFLFRTDGELGVFGLFAVLALAQSRLLNTGLGMLAAAVGLAGVILSGMECAASAPASMGAVLPMLFFVITALSLGAAFGMHLPSAQGQDQLRRALACVLVLALGVYFTAPALWGSENAMTRLTALAWSFSPWFWMFVSLGFLFPLFLIIGLRALPRWAAWVMFGAACIGRAQFFLDAQTVGHFLARPF